MCQVWFHAFSVKSDQGSQRRLKGIAVNVNFSIPPSLVITQVKKKLKITFSSISPYSHNISLSPSSLHFRPDFSLLLTFSDHFSLLPIVYLPPPEGIHVPCIAYDYNIRFNAQWKLCHLTCAGERDLFEHARMTTIQSRRSNNSDKNLVPLHSCAPSK